MAQVMTVTGPISPDELGTTAVHIHLLHELRLGLSEQGQLRDFSAATDRALVNKPITMDMLGIIRRNNSANMENRILGDVNEAIDELRYFTMAGGRSLVECSIIGMGRDPVGMRKIARATGINVISCSGWYLNSTHPPYVKDASIDELRAMLVREMTVGIGNTGIKTGALKAACSGRTLAIPFSGDEEKVLRATARAQAETGASMNIHPSHHCGHARHWQTYLDVLKQEGANLEKVYLDHMEWWAGDLGYQKSLLDQGANVAYDQFGHEYYMSPGMSYASDRERTAGVVALLKAGYVKQVLLSNETSYKTGLRKYGGLGYGHMLENSVLDLKFYGVTDDQINTMLVENPKRIIPF